MADYSQSYSTISRGENGAASKDADQLDSAGQAILKLLHKAAGAAEANSRQALETAQTALKPTSCCRRSDRGVRSGSSSLSREI